MQAKAPYVPSAEDCRMVVRTGEAICYMMDTCCRDITERQRAEIDEKVAHIYRQAALKKISKRHRDD